MRVKKLFIIISESGAHNDGDLILSARGLFYKYCGREGTDEVTIWKLKTEDRSWTLLEEWHSNSAYSGDFEIMSAEAAEALKEHLAPAKTPENSDAGAIIVAHGAESSISKRPPEYLADRVVEKSKAEGWPAFRKIVLDVCKSATVSSKKSMQDEPVVAQRFLKRYAEGVGAYDMAIMIAGYDAGVSVAYEGKDTLPDDGYEENDEGHRGFDKSKYGKKYLMPHSSRSGEAAWMSDVKGHERSYSNDISGSVKRIYNYTARRDEKGNIATEINLSGWSDRQ